MLTTMVEFQRLTNLTRQVYTIFTNDQKLYRTVVNVTWTYPAQFQNFILRIGGMHTLMNFAGAVGVLMSDTELESILFRRHLVVYQPFYLVKSYLRTLEHHVISLKNSFVKSFSRWNRLMG